MQRISSLYDRLSGWPFLTQRVCLSSLVPEVTDIRMSVVAGIASGAGSLDYSASKAA